MSHEEGPSFKKTKKNYDCYFNMEWIQDPEFKGWLVKEGNSAKCNICNITFLIKHDGLKAVKAHSASKNHREKQNSANKNKVITNFFTTKSSSEQILIARAETALVYHSIMHHHSYRSTDCGTKLASKIFYDSKVANKIRCGRTKAEAIAMNVLGPNSIDKVIKSIINHRFSIASDASNMKNRKMFPVGITYFCKEIGIQNKMIDFYEDCDESSSAITSQLTGSKFFFKLCFSFIFINNFRNIEKAQPHPGSTCIIFF